MASFFDKLKKQINPFDGGATWSNPNPKQAPARLPASQTAQQKIQTAKYGVLANNPQRQSQFINSVRPENKSVSTVKNTLSSVRDTYKHPSLYKGLNIPVKTNIVEAPDSTSAQIKQIQNDARTGKINRNVASAQINAVATNGNVKANQFNNSAAFNPTTTNKLGGGLINMSANRKVAPVTSGMYRSAIGTGESLVGLYDTLTPGKGNSKLGQNIRRQGEIVDKSVKQNNYNQLAYKLGQAGTDVATFMLPGGVMAKGAAKAGQIASKAPVIGKAVAGVNKAAKGGNLTAKATKYLLSPANVLNTASDTALNTGFRANRGQDINAGTLAMDAGLSTGMSAGIGLGIAGAKKAIPVGKAVGKETIGAQKRQAQDFAAKSDQNRVNQMYKEVQARQQRADAQQLPQNHPERTAINQLRKEADQAQMNVRDGAKRTTRQKVTDYLLTRPVGMGIKNVDDTGKAMSVDPLEALKAEANDNLKAKIKAQQKLDKLIKDNNGNLLDKKVGRQASKLKSDITEAENYQAVLNKKLEAYNQSKSAPVEKTAPTAVPESVLPKTKKVKTVYDTDKTLKAQKKTLKDIVEAEATQGESRNIIKEVQDYGGIGSSAYESLPKSVMNKNGRSADYVARELGFDSEDSLVEAIQNYSKVTKKQAKDEAIRKLETGNSAFSDDYNSVKKSIQTREDELSQLPLTAKTIDQKPSKISEAEWNSIAETAPFQATTTKQAIGQELASVRKELEASKKLATQLQERQKLQVIQGKEQVASKMRESNAKVYQDIKDLQAKEKELAKRYAQELPPDNRVNMSDPKNIDGIEERYTSTLKDKVTKQTFKDLSREYLGSVEASKIGADKRAMDFTKKFNLTDEEKLAVINATDNPTIKTSGKVKEAVDDLHKTYDDLYTYFTKEKGVDMGYQHDYYPREYVNTKTGDQMTAAEYDLLQRASKRSRSRTSDSLADWKLKYTDPAEGLKSYYQNLEKAAAGRKYMQDLEKQGLVVWGDGQPMQGYRPIIAEGLQPSKGGVYYAKKEVADKLDTMFGSKEATNIVEKALEKGEGLNSFWQSVVLSGGIPNTPINAFGFMQVMKEGMALHPIKAAKAMYGGMNKGFSQKYFEAKSPVMTLMAKEGIPIRYSIAEGAKKGLGRTKQAFNESKARGINQAWNELTNDATFGRFMPLLEVQHFENIYKHGLKKGLSPEKASKIAGESTKNFYGITDLYSKKTRPGIVDKASGTFLFAPRFRESMLNFWGKNIKTLGVSDGKWNALKPEYRDNAKFLVAAAATYAAYDMLNKELNGTHLWENPDGKKDKLLIPGVDPGGKTLGIPFLPSIGTVPREAGMGLYHLGTFQFKEAAKNASRFASLPVATIGELATNENPFSGKIMDENASVGTRATQAASYVGQKLMQPWVKEGLNAAGQGLPDGVKDALGVKKKSGIETISNALESPVRFYDPKYFRGGGDNFKTATGTVGSDKASKDSQLTLDEAKKIQKNTYGGKFAKYSEDELKDLAKTDSDAKDYLKSLEATKAAFGKTPDLPDGLNDSAKKIYDSESRLTKEGKEKWLTRPANNKTVDSTLKNWLGKDVPPATNKVAKLWAEYEKDRVEGKISKLETDKRKRTILKEAFNSQLNDDEKDLYKLSEADLKSAYGNNLINDENISKALEVEKQLFEAGLIKQESLHKKLDLSARGYKTSSRSSKRSGGSARSNGISLSELGSTPFSSVYKTTASHQKRLRQILARAMV